MGDSIPLTDKQQEILDYIKGYIDDHGFPPAIRDIGKAFDIKSPNGVMCHLRALQKKGYIKREEKNEFQGGIARSITIAGEGRHSNRGGFSLPMLGLIAAGPVLEAQEQNERVDMRDLFGGDNVYMLKVRGESMIDSQIADGDYVVIRKQDQADNGEKVVAMVDRSMTLKKFYRRKDTISLEPCNSTMKPIVVDPSRENVQILGVLVGVIRKCQ